MDIQSFFKKFFPKNDIRVEEDALQVVRYKGSSINHVIKILGIFDPPPPFVVTFTK